MWKQATGIGLVVTLAACGNSSGPVPNAFLREAGTIVDSGEFGNATMNNTQIHISPEQFAVNLANRFAREVPSTVNFEFNSAILDENARVILRRQADWIRQFPEVRFRVYGHTDLVGSNAYNRRLGQRRADAVVAFLSQQGISRSRLEAVVSFGETRPVIATPNPERQNRRTVTEVSGFLQRHPTVLDGKYAQIVYREYVDSATAETGLSGISEAGGDG